MNLYWEKMVGYPLFVVTGGFALDWSLSHTPVLFLPFLVVYPVIVILMARDPLMDCPHIVYRMLVVATAIVILCWLQRWPLQFMVIAAIYLVGPNYGEGRAGLGRFWSEVRRRARQDAP